jgi:hypothetical protein
MVYCSCGKPMDKVPDWLAAVQVEFVCNNCPNRKVKNIASVTLEPEVAPTARLDAEEIPEEEEEEAEAEAE